MMLQISLVSAISASTSLPKCMPTNARKHYLDVNCASNFRKHLIVSIPTISALSDHELSSYISVVKGVFWKRDWTITWVAGSSITMKDGESSYHLAIKNENAHKSTVKKRLLAALTLHRQELFLKECTASDGEMPSLPAEPVVRQPEMLPVMVRCRNGEGPLAQHLYPSSNGANVHGVVVEGIKRDKLRTMAQIVRQHRKKRGTGSTSQKKNEVQSCKRQRVSPRMFDEKPLPATLAHLPVDKDATLCEADYLQLDFDDIFAGTNRHAAIVREALLSPVSYMGSPMNSPNVSPSTTSIIKSELDVSWVFQ